MSTRPHYLEISLPDTQADREDRARVRWWWLVALVLLALLLLSEVAIPR